MIVCSKCDDVLYFGVMPNNCAELERVMCSQCAFDYTMDFENYYENESFDIMADR